MGDAAVVHGVGEGRGDVFLAEDLGEALGPVLAVKGEISHRLHPRWGLRRLSLSHLPSTLLPEGEKEMAAPPPWTDERPPLSPAAGSGPATLRHSRDTAYGCSLPGLTGFTAPGRAGPDHQRCLPRAARSLIGRGRLISPAYRGFPVQGTPTPPPSAAGARLPVAETKGFEPLDPLGSHDFQSCRFGRSRTSPPVRIATAPGP